MLDKDNFPHPALIASDTLYSVCWRAGDKRDIPPGSHSLTGQASARALLSLSHLSSLPHINMMFSLEANSLPCAGQNSSIKVLSDLPAFIYTNWCQTYGCWHKNATLSSGQLCDIRFASSHAWQRWVGVTLLPGSPGYSWCREVLLSLLPSHPSSSQMHRVCTGRFSPLQAPMTPSHVQDAWGQESKQGAWLFICVSHESFV